MVLRFALRERHHNFTHEVACVGNSFGQSSLQLIPAQRAACVPNRHSRKRRVPHSVCSSSRKRSGYREGHDSPSSRECLDSFVSLWVGWAGWPQTLSCDRGVHNRGVFARTLAQHGVLIRQAGVESPEQIGRVERHGGLFKAVLKRMITEHAVQGFDDIKNRDR